MLYVGTLFEYLLWIAKRNTLTIKLPFYAEHFSFIPNKKLFTFFVCLYVHFSLCICLYRFYIVHSIFSFWPARWLYISVFAHSLKSFRVSALFLFHTKKYFSSFFGYSIALFVCWSDGRSMMRLLWMMKMHTHKNTQWYNRK